MNTRFKTWATIKVMFVNGKEIELENVKEVKEDDTGYVYFVDLYGDTLLVVNGVNMLGFYEE